MREIRKAKINAQAAVPTRLSKQWCVCQCLGFVTCAQMLTRAIAHWGCRDTVIGSALETDSGRKIPGRTADSNPSLSSPFGLTLYPLSYRALSSASSDANVPKVSGRISGDELLTTASFQRLLASRDVCQRPCRSPIRTGLSEGQTLLSSGVLRTSICVRHLPFLRSVLLNVHRDPKDY